MDERYIRQTKLEAIGEQGQAKLKESRVLVIGAGGLGSPALYYLCAAGIGHIGIADFDGVGLSNLNRQILHSEKDIGKLKAISAQEKLNALNHETDVRVYAEKLGLSQLSAIIPEYDAVVDCVDTVKTRIHVARACIEAKKPVVEAGVEGFCGFVMSYRPGSACYACISRGTGDSRKEEFSVIGAAPGVAGSIQSAECVKLLLGVGEPLVNKMLFFDLLYQTYDTVEISPDPHCAVCSMPHRQP